MLLSPPRSSFVVASAVPADVRSLRPADPLAFPAVATSAQVLPSDSSDVPQYPRRLPGSVVVTTSSATMRGRVTERDFLLSLEPLMMVGSQHNHSQDNDRSQVHMSEQLHSCQETQYSG